MRDIKYKIGHWHFLFGIVPHYGADGWYCFQLGIFKLLSYPKEGCCFMKSNYSGFWIRKSFSLRGFLIHF